MRYLICRSGWRRRSGLLFAAALLFATPAIASVEVGKYQAVLGDCAGCHGKDLAGGVTLMTPFGKLVTPNITPDKNTGIGSWSAEDFRQAMKEGVAPGGKLLYPAMPYVNYARMHDGDVAALWDYLRTVKPVRNTIIVNQLRFPFNLRFLMRGWNILFFRPAPHADNPDKSAVWNRGAYLITGPTHCGACHSPKNFFGADKSLVLSGASLQGWFAPDLTGDAKAGLGGWSADDIVQYLATGRNVHSIASGPMAEAVENSTSKMANGDLKAIAVYLKDMPPSAGNGGGASGIETQMKSGVALYDVNCAACHGRDGKGSVIFPPLAGSAVVNQASAETLARVVLAGTKGAATAKAPTGQAMPSFAWKLSDAQVADILTYVRNNWGNAAPAMSSDAVGKIRVSLHSGS
jgi:mono/diheme cytochrome c family protein